MNWLRLAFSASKVSQAALLTEASDEFGLCPLGLPSKYEISRDGLRWGNNHHPGYTKREARELQPAVGS